MLSADSLCGKLPSSTNAVAAYGEPVPLPPVAIQCDYELELAVVIGRTVRNVDEGAALDHVFGSGNANDVSARDIQTRTSRWLPGKTLDQLLPLDPYLATADAVGEALVEAVPSQGAQLDLDDVESAAMLGGEVQLQTVPDPLGLGRRERRVKRGRVVDVEVVQHEHEHEHDSVGGREVAVDQLRDAAGGVDPGGLVADQDRAPAAEWLGDEEEVGYPVPHVFGIMPADPAGA